MNGPFKTVLKSLLSCDKLPEEAKEIFKKNVRLLLFIR